MDDDRSHYWKKYIIYADSNNLEIVPNHANRFSTTREMEILNINISKPSYEMVIEPADLAHLHFLMKVSENDSEAAINSKFLQQKKYIYCFFAIHTGE